MFGWFKEKLLQAYDFLKMDPAMPDQNVTIRYGSDENLTQHTAVQVMVRDWPKKIELVLRNYQATWTFGALLLASIVAVFAVIGWLFGSSTDTTSTPVNVHIHIHETVDSHIRLL